ncbi:choice-of-anchor L domain-containing protein, partial [uncultured Kiloniella sp.]|uniref:choice-of-anchor L domain-containing protein n=1 Tax=uncultured Kiloniella sp. TaxID=1133091 RepID=UPI00260BA8FF
MPYSEISWKNFIFNANSDSYESEWKSFDLDPFKSEYASIAYEFLIATGLKNSPENRIQSDFQDAIQEVVSEMQAAHEEGILDAFLAKLEDLNQLGEVVVDGLTLNIASFFDGDAAADISSNGFKAADFEITSVKQVALIHFARNILTEDKNYEDLLLDGLSESKFLPALKNAFHRFGDGYKDTFKIVQVKPDGTSQEYVIRYWAGQFEVIDDPANRGSFNFVDSSTSSSGHVALDVDTWKIFGNNINDPSSYDERTAMVKTIVDAANNPLDHLSKGSPMIGSALNEEFWLDQDKRTEVKAGGGNDLIHSAPQNDTIDGGSGYDTVSYSDEKTGSGVAVWLGAGFAFNAGASYDNKHEVLDSIEAVIGSNFGDILIGSTGGNKIKGLGGRDILNGLGGNDILEGGKGADTIKGGAGFDTAVFDGDLADYILENGETAILVTDSVGRTDELTSIEKLEFNDAEVLTENGFLSDAVSFGDFTLDTFANNAVSLGLDTAEDAIEAFFDGALDGAASSVTYTGAETAGYIVPEFEIGTVATITNGIFLSSGGLVGNSNTSSSFTVEHITDGDADLGASVEAAFPAAGSTGDAAVVSLTINVTDPDIDGLRFSLVFGSDEYPEYSDSSFVDIAGVYVNGVNYALFNNDPNYPLSVMQSNIDQGNFIDNTGSLYPVEWDGFSEPMSIRAPLVQGENTIKIAVADTGDNSYDSGLFAYGFSFLDGGAVVSGILDQVIQEEGVDSLVASEIKEELILATGAGSTVKGTAQSLNEDVIVGFETDDKIMLQGAIFSSDDMSVTFGSAILDIDTDGDGIKETTITLEGDFEDGTFKVVNEGGDTTITYLEPQEDTTQADSSGDDLLIGTSIADTFFGYAGNDTLLGRGGSDTLNGGGGIDLIKGGKNNDLLKGGGGADFLKGQGELDTLLGGKHDDTLAGGTGNDMLKGQSGQDKLLGGKHDDTLAGGTGNDMLKGQSGKDKLIGGSGADSLYGASGDDKLTGSKGADYLVGGSGNDTLRGGSGDDTFFFTKKGSGDDHVLGFEEGDIIKIKGYSKLSVEDFVDEHVSQNGKHVTIELDDDSSIL